MKAESRRMTMPLTLSFLSDALACSRMCNAHASCEHLVLQDTMSSTASHDGQGHAWLTSSGRMLVTPPAGVLVQPVRTRCRQTLHLPVAFSPSAQKGCCSRLHASSPRCLHS